MLRHLRVVISGFRGGRASVRAAGGSRDTLAVRRRRSGALQRTPASEQEGPFPIAEQAERALDRRRFLVVAGCAAVLVAAGERVGAHLDAVVSTAPEVTLPDPAVPAPGTAQSIAAADGRETLVVKLDDGEIVAFDRRCPHLGCPVLWSAERGRFECPCHHAAFEARTGRVLFGPPRRGLTQANVRSA